LEVLESNADARRLYDRLGFRTVERVLAAGVDSLVGGEPAGPTFGFVHVQTDDLEKVRREAAKVLRTDPGVELGSGWVRVGSAGGRRPSSSGRSRWTSATGRRVSTRRTRPAAAPSSRRRGGPCRSRR